MTADNFLGRLVAAFERTGVPYMLTGSFASSAHGRVRATEDIDIVIAPSAQQLHALIAEFSSDRYYLDKDAALEALRERGQFNIVDIETAWKADLIVQRDRAFSRTEFDRRRPHMVGDLKVYVAAAEDVLIAKLEWAHISGSDRQIEDAAGIIESQGDRLDRAYVERWVRELGLEKPWQHAQQKAL